MTRIDRKNQSIIFFTLSDHSCLLFVLLRHVAARHGPGFFDSSHCFGWSDPGYGRPCARHDATDRICDYTIGPDDGRGPPMVRGMSPPFMGHGMPPPMMGGRGMPPRK